MRSTERVETVVWRTNEGFAWIGRGTQDRDLLCGVATAKLSSDGVQRCIEFALDLGHLIFGQFGILSGG